VTALDLGLAALGVALLALVWLNHLAREPETPASLAAARGAVAADPLSTNALSDFAAAIDASGGDAAPVYGFLAERTWRDTRAAGWRLRRLVAEARYHGALAEADSMLRRGTDDAVSERVLRLVAAFARYPVPRAALVDRLAGSPPWRDVAIARLASVDRSSCRQVLQSLAGGPTPPTRAEWDDLLRADVEAEDGVAEADDRAAIQRAAPGSINGLPHRSPG